MKIILTGILSRTEHGTYVGGREALLAFAEGFTRMGHEVYFFEEVEASHCLDSEGRTVPFREWDGRRRFDEAMHAYGLGPRSALIFESGVATHGLDWATCLNVGRETSLLLTIGGRFTNPEIHAAVEHSAYLDINPGKTQAYAFVYDVDYGLEAFDSHFTVGLSVGTPACPLPTGGFQWQPLFCPVVLDRWRPTCAPGASLTTITTWGKKHQFSLGGRSSGDKVGEWLRFIELPKRSRQELTLALPLRSVSHADRTMLGSSGWEITDAAELRTLSDYVDFVSRSKGEFSVANARYVRFRTAWVSDRTARYLAAGRPALVQSTGIEQHLPVGEGLLTFSTVDEAVEGIRELDADYDRHCKRAFELGREYFDSDRVLGGMLTRVGAS